MSSAKDYTILPFNTQAAYKLLFLSQISIKQQIYKALGFKDFEYTDYSS